MAQRTIVVLFRSLAVSAVLAGCGSGPAPVAPRAQSAGLDAAARLTALTALDQRVAAVAARLLPANADLCPVVRRSAGWALHAASQYSEQLRPYARERFGLDRDLPGVLSAPSMSAAADAGLREGDLILVGNGTTLNAGPERIAARFEGLAANIAVIDVALARGSTRLDIQRGGDRLSVMVEPRRACGYEIQLNPSDELNARADGRRLFISTALAGFTQSDDELALILGHELAHHVLRHRTWSDVGGAGREANDATTVIETGDKETQADRVGLFLAARAGYDTRVAPAFWRRFGAANRRVRYPQLRHASAEGRARALEQVQIEIDTKRASGAPLVP